MNTPTATRPRADTPDLPDWRSAWGHAMSDAVQDLIRGYDLTAAPDADALVKTLCQDLGICKPQRLPVPARLALIRWCAGALDAARAARLGG